MSVKERAPSYRLCVLRRRPPSNPELPPGWHLVYDLGRDEARVKQIQKVSRETEEFGFPTSPALFGSPKWWRLIDRGVLTSHVLEGVIESVYWGSMADYPEFRLRIDGGGERTFTREGDTRRYVEGLRARVRVVELDRKPAQVAKGLEPIATQVLSIALEDSRLRSPGVAPGPGGVGYEIAGGRGSRVVYFAAETPAAAEAMATDGETLGGRARTWKDLAGTSWAAVTVASHAEVEELRVRASHRGARFDGYEIVPNKGEEPVAYGPDDA